MAKSDYRIAAGFNIALGSLVAFNPQPRSIGLKHTRRSYTSTGVFPEGLYVELLWSALEGEAEYQAILSRAGVLTVDHANVTLRCRDDTFTYQRYNGMVLRPSIGDQVDWNYFPQNVIMIVRNLELST